MNETLFRTLLYGSEGPDLDFKRDQYAFIGATDDDKSKLLKDILTFANSWRKGDAYILIGIEDLKDGRHNPAGISPADHIDDAKLQQFVNSKTNRKVEFTYEPFHYDGLSFGVITIPKQKRPVYAVKNYGIVRAGEVYYRQGSSCAVATPDEIGQMVLDDEGDVTRQEQDRDYEMYAALCAWAESQGGNALTIPPGTDLRLWAERMVDKGRLVQLPGDNFIPAHHIGPGWPGHLFRR